MKKLFVLFIILALALCACGSPEPAQDQQTQPPATTQPVQQTQPQAETTAPTQAPEETQAPTEETQDNSAKALAQSCIDKQVEELYALIGEPESADYAPSCLGDGEDGNLYYDGFVVYTYREGDSETVRYVE